MRHDGITLTAMILLAAFTIERATAGVLFLLSFSERWRAAFPDSATYLDQPMRAHAERRGKLMRFALATGLALVALLFVPDLRVLEALGISSSRVLDGFLTWLVLVAGSDRLGELLGSGRGSEYATPPSKAYQIAGELKLVESEESKPAAARS